MDTAGKHMTDGREINHIFLDKFTLQLPKRDILQLVFVLQECAEVTAGTGVVHERTGCPVFADALLGELFQVIIEGFHQELITIPETQPGISDLLGRNVKIPITDTLVLLADVGLDVLQFFVDPLGYDTLTQCFVGFGIPQFGRDSHFATELRDGSVDGDASHDLVTQLFPNFAFSCG